MIDVEAQMCKCHHLMTLSGKSWKKHTFEQIFNQFFKQNFEDMLLLNKTQDWLQDMGYLSNFATGFQKVPFFLKLDQNQWFQNSRFHFYLVFIWK